MEKLRNLDHKIFNYLNNFTGCNNFFDNLTIFIAVYLIYFVPLLFVILWFVYKKMQKVLLKAFSAGLLAWFGLCNLIGAIHYRARPFTAQANAKELVFHRPDRSFPSDHSAFLFAVAFTLWFLGYKKLSAVIFVIAVFVSFFRVVAGIHYPADIVAGLMVGFIAALIIWFLRDPLDIIFNPLIALAKKLRLA